MRVITGKYGGRRLVSFSADHVRPTTDRVKETLFNKLMGRVDGARVLDLFSGTGSLAIECLSRGASWVDLVENHPRSLAIIRENMAMLEIEAGYKIWPVDAFKYIRDHRGDPYDLVLADPPFTKALAHDLAVAIGGSRLLSPGGCLVIEAAGKEPMEPEYEGLESMDTREFGDKRLRFFRSGRA